MAEPDPTEKPDEMPPKGPLPRSPARTGGDLQPANEAESPPQEPENKET